MLTTLAVPAHARLTAQAPGAAPELPAHHPDRILARLMTPDGARAQATATTLGDHGLRISRHIDSVPGLVVIESAPVTRASALAAPATLDQRIAALRATGLFAYVERDPVLSIQALPRDAHLLDGALWGLRNTGQHGGTPGIDVGVVRAWEITTGSREVVVAVVDTGIDYTHTELRDQIWRNPGEIPGNGIDDDGNGFIDDVFGLNAIDPRYPPFDDHDHGTHVAGTIGAAAHDGHPLVGVSPQVRLMACKFLTAEGWGYTTDAVACIDYAARHGATIINASWGGGGYSQALVDSIAAAGEVGALFVAAAGNSGLDLQSEQNERYPAYPAGYTLDTIVAVAAIDRHGALASFSNYGHLSVDLGAPGVEILSSTARSGKSGYDTYRGTSMAAPHVAGVAALARARHPALTAAELKVLLVDTATPTPSLEGRTVSGGRVDAYGAVSAQPGQRLALTLSLPTAHVATIGRPLLVTAFVTDLHAATGATVTGSTNHGETLHFRDDGVAPDAHADDGVYSAFALAQPENATLTITAQAARSGRSSSVRSVTIPVVQRPPNDSFANATRLSDHVIRISTTNRAATVEPGEPAHAGQPGGASLWWAWTAPADCTVSLIVASSWIDTLLAVYTGSSLDTVVLVASNDNDPILAPSSALTFAATAGTEYRIVVDAWDGATGPFDLVLTRALPPPNDAFEHAERLDGNRASTLGSTRLATSEAGETSSRGLSGPSAWYTWTAPANGTADLEVVSFLGGSNTIEVYTGDAPATLSPVTNLVSGPSRHWSLYRFPAVGGTTYRVAIRAFNAEDTGHFQLDLRLLDPPSNDAFAARLPLAGDEFQLMFDTRGASIEPGESPITPDSSASIWYTWTAPRDGTASFRIPPESGLVPAMAAFTGAQLETLTRVAFGDHEPFLLRPPHRGTHLVFEATRDTTYAILIDGVEGASGAGSLQFRLLEPPLNHRRASAFPIPDNDFITTGSNRGVADPPLQTSIALSPATVWWSWPAPANGRCTIDVSTTHFQPDIRLLPTGQGWSPIVLGESTHLAGGRQVYQVQAGITYHLGIGGNPSFRHFPFYNGPDGIRGDFTLRTAFTSETHDTFATRRIVSGATVSTTSSNRASISNQLDPTVDDHGHVAPLWWSWTAPLTGAATFSSAASEYDTVLALFTGDRPTAESRIAASVRDVFGRSRHELSIPVVAGTTYHVLVDSTSGEVGAVSLAVRCAPIPANDAFAMRAELPGLGAIATADTIGAADEPGEPHHAFMPPSRSVWWTWTATQPGSYVVTTAGSDFDTVLAVYTGDSLETLQLVGSNDDATGSDLASRVAFFAAPGSVWHFAVDGYRGDAGAVSIQVIRNRPPSIDIVAPFHPIPAGGPLSIVAVSGSIDGVVETYRYQWFHNGVPIPGATGATLHIPIAQRFHAGSYTVVVTGLAGTVQRGPITIAIDPPPASSATIANLSTRAHCLGGDEILIPGFVITGAGTRRILVRAVGPELIPFGVHDVLIDPTMIVTRRSDAGFIEIARNEDWTEQPGADAVAAATEAVHAFPLDPESSSAALLLDLPSGEYTVHASGGGESGIGLVELYDLAPDDAAAGGAQLINLSTRGYAGSGDTVMIPGFVIVGEGARTFLLRAVGPGLSAMGVAGPLADPRLHVFRHHDGAAELILTNASWGENGDATEIAEATATAGAFALTPGSADAALVVTLPAGVYTVHASGAAGGAGVVLVELYLLP